MINYEPYIIDNISCPFNSYTFPKAFPPIVKAAIKPLISINNMEFIVNSSFCRLITHFSKYKTLRLITSHLIFEKQVISRFLTL